MSSEELTVEQYIDNAIASGESKEKAARQLYKLIENGDGQIVEPKQASNLLEYLTKPYGVWVWAVVLFIALVLSSIYLIPSFAPYVYIRYIAGALFVLYLPGYVLLEALYPKADELDRLERLALSIGLSLALVPLVGLVLNYTPWGIRLEPILVSLIILTLALAVLAAYRKLKYIILSSHIH
ncbi:MAG: DUF1616 domain-containing protein [Conexivisphaerales archaeon]